MKMRKRAVLVCGLCGALTSNCTNSSSGSPDASTGTSTGPGSGSLVGTWNLTTTPTGNSAVVTTLTIGQDSLNITSPDFTLTANRTGKVRWTWPGRIETAAVGFSKSSPIEVSHHPL